MGGKRPSTTSSTDGGYINRGLDMRTEIMDNAHNETATCSTSTTGSYRPDRLYYEQDQLNNDFRYRKLEYKTCDRYISNLKEVRPKSCFLSIFPVFSWLSSYSLKNDFFNDLISGCTVAVMHIPQGMGYAILGNVPPITGIYMAFFPVILYFFLGTSRHNSMGTFAVVSIMVGKVVLTHSTLQTSTGEAGYSPTQIATAICFIVGIIQIVMYFLRLGIISSLLSETLVSGFTTGAAIHVLTSQIKDLFGITLPPVLGNFEIIKTYTEIFRQISNLNVAATLISAITIVIMVINNDFIKPKVAKKCSIPIPIELIGVVSGTVISQLMDLKNVYNIKTIGAIPTGFPEPTIPEFGLFRELLVDSFTIGMVSYTVSVSMALIFAQKFCYEIDGNQELLAMGAGNIFGSFFGCMPFSASLSRSVIQQTVGGRTQIASVVSCAILVTVLLWIGPFFELLPRCVLASIIVVALKGMLMQVLEFKKFARLSWIDAVVWMATFLSVVIFAIDIGLLVGIVLSVASIFFRALKPYTCLLNHVPNTDLYLDADRYQSAQEIPYVKIFHYCGSLNFASRHTFKGRLLQLLNINLVKEIKNLNKLLDSVVADAKSTKYQAPAFKCLIIDFSALGYIDPSGVATLKLLIKDFHKLGITVCISGSSCPVYETLTKCGLSETNEPNSVKMFPTVHNAVLYANEYVSPISVVTS